MHSFFRKIRQALLVENRLGHDLIYALGETIRVMVGILIALKINNWNQFVVDHQLTLDNIKNLQAELEADFQQYTRLIEEQELRIHQVNIPHNSFEYNAIVNKSEFSKSVITERKQDTGPAFGCNPRIIVNG
ncbi:MAG: DUF6090 family protein [Saprospiraceae bacterium]